MNVYVITVGKHLIYLKQTFKKTLTKEKNTLKMV